MILYDIIWYYLILHDITSIKWFKLILQWYIINFQEQCSNGYLFQVRFGQNYRYGEQGTHGTGHGCVGAAHGYVSMVLGTIPMYRTHRTHHTYPVSDRSSNRFLKIKHVFLKFLLIIMFKRYIKKLVARSVANWVRMVGTVGTVHGYGTIGTVPAPKHLPNTRTRTQQRYPIPIPVTVPNNTQHPYPYPTPAPNTRTQHPYRTSVPVPVPIEMTPRTLRNRLNREAWFHCFQKLINDINLSLFLSWYISMLGLHSYVQDLFGSEYICYKYYIFLNIR